MKWFLIIKHIPLLILFVLTKKTKKEIITADLYARKTSAGRSSSVFTDLAAELASPYFRNLFYFRLQNTLSKILRIIYKGESTFIIDVNTKLGAGVRLAHPYATILNAQSIGDNLYINHLVTVGEINGKKPVIGHNVELHANCTIVGPVTIGDGAVIGAGAVVVKDVPPTATVVGNPSRFITKKCR